MWKDPIRYWGFWRNRQTLIIRNTHSLPEDRESPCRFTPYGVVRCSSHTADSLRFRKLALRAQTCVPRRCQHARHHENLQGSSSAFGRLCVMTSINMFCENILPEKVPSCDGTFLCKGSLSAPLMRAWGRIDFPYRRATRPAGTRTRRVNLINQMIGFTFEKTVNEIIMDIFR